MTNISLPRISIKLISSILLISFLAGYSLENTKKRQTLISDARKVSNVVSDTFDYASTLSIYLGKVISENEKFEDLQFINSLFKETVYNQGSLGDVLSWAMFNWGDKKHNLVVRTVGGIQKNPQNLVERNYAWRTKYEKWKMHFVVPDYGIISQTLVLPSAVGVSDARDQFMGSIIFGINLKSLLRKSESVINSENAFILVNKDSFNQSDGKIIISSSNAPRSSESYKNLPNIVDNLRDWINKSGTMENPILAGRFKFSYYHAIENHPLVLIVGFNIIDFWVSVLSLSVKIFIILLVLAILVREHKRLVKERRMRVMATRRKEIKDRKK